MDPNETLRQIRELACKIEARFFLGAQEWDAQADAQELTGAFRDLDQWLSTGGALPDGWDVLPSDSKV